MSIMGALAMAWAAKNGPLLLKDLHIMTKKVRVFMAAIKRAPGNALGVIKSAISFATTFMATY